MAHNSNFCYHNGFSGAFRGNAFHNIIAAATKSSKGFGRARKPEEHKSKRDGSLRNDNKDFKEVAASIATHRPVKPEEAARGKLDYVQVEDWGDGDRAKLGELRLVSHVQQYEGGASTAMGPGNSDIGGSRPFHTQLAHQLKMAEARGALAVAGPPPPPVTEWSFREARYAQYLADQLEVHEALEAALLEATAGATTTTTGDNGGNSSSSTRRGDAAAIVTAAPVPTLQDSVQALLQLVPGRLGLERSAAIRRDLAALRATAGHPAAVAAARRCAAGTTSVPESAAAVASEADPDAEGRAASLVASIPGVGVEGRRGESANTSVVVPSPLSASDDERTAGPMARSYAQLLRRLGRAAAAGDDEQERQPSSLRLLAHAAVLHLVAQAVWVRLGATATERLALLQRGAAATYHEYPGEVTDPRVSLSRALDAAGEHLRSPAARQVVFDEVPGAMQKTGLLMSALAHRD
ncbi:hypothetical protein VaNZ11_001207 [Volvox africanus]|uniref:Uncharacterized protein n=1 Tax=Volvox africanus TaxID=51714 RepID=A0ABQ5RP91_9CHLO|nr:hypothetical protein VaNZ11_001207 [Volvox africanus]